MTVRAALLAASLATLSAAFDATPTAQQSPPAPARKSPFLKLIEPWPTDEVLLARRTEADARHLFRDAAPLAFTLTADFGSINKDRNPASTKRYAATLSTDGSPD